MTIHDHISVKKEDQYPLEFIEINKALKLNESENSITVGLCDPDDIFLREHLQSFHHKKIIYRKIDPDDLSLYLGRILSADDGISVRRVAESAGDKNLLDKLANDAPIVNLVNSILMEGIRKNASDIHIEAMNDGARVRYRVDGVLAISEKVEKHMFRAVSTRIKYMSNLNIMESRKPQDGRMTVSLGGKDLDIRVSIVPTVSGESIVLRVFDKNKALGNLETLGLSENDLENFKRLYNHPFGLLLITGPTGSGKTTTLNSIIREINTQEFKTITIEDPVEYHITGVEQIQTNETIGLTFESILRRVLRQDPDIIMVGEIRDLPTAELAIRAALTGHLVLSTLHTNDSVSAIQRLTSMGVPSYLVAAVLRGAAAQRLVRTICPACKAEKKPGPVEKNILARLGYSGKIFEGRGCNECNNSGYAGRTAVFEWFHMGPELEGMIIGEANMDKLRESIFAREKHSLRDDLVKKLAGGITTISEALKVISFYG
ncbi:MAG: type II/IV secretion system protein [Spirochaetales bacterium]|nr:type II/IV secretion system protein [Spirochaetales bacterium]